MSLQFAVALVVMTAAGMFPVSFWRLQHAYLGFRPENIVSAAFILPEQRYASEERQIAFFRDLERKLTGLPGVISAAITDSLRPGGDPRSFPFVALTGGGDAEAMGIQGLVKWRYVTPDYFKTLAIPIRRGPGFTEEDRSSGIQAIVVSESLARRIFGGADPIGRTLNLWEQRCAIAGVAADVRNSGLRTAPDGEIYVLRRRFANGVSRNQRPPYGWRSAIAIIRTTVDDRFAAAALRHAVQAIEPRVPVVSGTVSSQVREHMERPRFHAFLLSLFAIFGLMLAAAGLYGLTSFLAAARRREIGVRMALGATRAEIVALLMKSANKWTAAGIVMGLLASIGIMRFLVALLFEVKPLDSRVLAGGITLLAAASAAGTWIPS